MQEFWLSPQNPLTVATIGEILAQQITVRYAPATGSASGKAVLSASLSPTDLAAKALGLGLEVPGEIVPLLLLLQADFLLKSSVPVDSAVIARLLEFYQYGILPQVFTQGLVATPVAHLLLPVFGEGKVYYQGYLLQAADVHDIFSWQPVTAVANELASWLTTPTLGAGYLVYDFIRLQQLYQFARNILPALSSESNQINFFPALLTQLAEQLNAFLAQPAEQALLLPSLAQQLTQLLAAFSEYTAQRFSDQHFTTEQSNLTGFGEITSRELQQLAQTLAAENSLLYKVSYGEPTAENSRLANRLFTQLSAMRQSLEKILALVTVAYVSEAALPTAEINLPADLAAAYRKQVSDVLPETSFAELIRKTIAFMYAFV